MAKSVAIIGSFQKYYLQVIELIELFNERGLYVTSPKKSKICHRVDDFVIFESDNHKYTPEEIQLITLDKILIADSIYVYNPEGYVGRTTCYEIGFCLSRFKPVYFLNKPIDLPIPVDEEQIVSPVEFSKIVRGEKYTFLSDYKICDEAKIAFKHIFPEEKQSNESNNRNIIICGSMKFFEQMVACKNQLELKGLNCIVPKDEENIVNLFSEEQMIQFKRKVSNAYLKKIRDRNTIAVLIYNGDKNGKENYIGANTLVEIAMAFIWNRKIYLLNDIYEPLKDELVAWNCICLKGDLKKLVLDLSNENPNNVNSNLQLSFKDFLDGDVDDC